MGLDAYYTPAEAARRLIVKLRLKPRNVVDFCAGGGELLRMAQEKFPQIECVANDKSRRAVRHLRNLHSDWQVYNVDVLSERKMRAAGFRESSYDLILYNPPFTSRGTRYSFVLDDFRFTGGKAVLFVASVLKYLSPQGVLRAILPSGVVDSERDAVILSYLKSAYGFKVICEARDITFGGKKPNVIFVELHQKKQNQKWKHEIETECVMEGALIRGVLSVPCAMKIWTDQHLPGYVRFIHTTNLKDNVIMGETKWVPGIGQKIICGPCVVVPRVGNAAIRKVAIICAGQRFVISDCLIAITCQSLSEAKHLLKAIRKHEKEYSLLYVGTGARYTTLRKLTSFLDHLGLKSRHFRMDTPQNGAVRTSEEP